MRARRGLAILALAALPAAAVETAAWPPPEGVAARMKQLQSVMADRAASAAQRDAARRELTLLLKSPAARARPGAADKPARAARAAIEPVPTTVIPSPNNSVPTPGVARLEIVEPPKPVLDPRMGGTLVPAPGGFALDPRTGNVLHPVPGGAVDPLTGRFVPR